MQCFVANLLGSLKEVCGIKLESKGEAFMH